MYNFLIFWVFLYIRGHGNFEKSLSSFLRVTGLNIYRKIQKWCCRCILKLFRLFRARKKFCINFSFFEFFCISGVMDFLKITKFFFESYGPEIHWKLHKWCCGCTLKLFRSFRAKNKFSINFSFLSFFAYH